MGFFEGLFGKKSMVEPFEYSLDCSFHPFRLRARHQDSVDLEVRVRNNSDKELLTSIVVVCSKELGFEKIGLQQEHETRLGPLKPREERFLKVPVWSNQKTPPGVFKVKVFAIAHYLDYAHVLNEVKRSLEIRAA